jgi:hypothetical protein
MQHEAGLWCVQLPIIPYLHTNIFHGHSQPVRLFFQISGTCAAMYNKIVNNIGVSNGACTPSTPTPTQDALHGFDTDADTTAGTSPSLMSSPPTHRVPHKYVQLLSPPSCVSLPQEPPPPLQLHVDKHWSQVWAVHRRLIKIEAVHAPFYLLVSLLLVLMRLVLPHVLVVNQGADGAALCPDTRVPPCVVLQACRYKPAHLRRFRSSLHPPPSIRDPRHTGTSPLPPLA